MSDGKKNVIAIRLYLYYMLLDRDRLMRKRVRPRMNVVCNAFHSTEETRLFHLSTFESSYLTDLDGQIRSHKGRGKRKLNL